MNGAKSSDAFPGEVQGVCPDGWHVPSKAEWETLITYLGGTFSGGKMKETDTTHWSSPNVGATNESGFTALPGGYRLGPNGEYENKGCAGNWWTIDDYLPTPDDAYYIKINCTSDVVISVQNRKYSGYSIRCIKD